MSDVLNVPLFLETLRANDKYREEFIEIAPDVKADVVSFQGNPNCGCRRKIHEFVQKNTENISVKTFFAKWKREIPNLFFKQPDNGPQTTSTPNTNMTVEATKTPPAFTFPPQQAVGKSPKMMQGHVVEIPATPTEYKNLVEHAKTDTWVYRGLTVMDSVDADGQKTWLVFFY